MLGKDVLCLNDRAGIDLPEGDAIREPRSKEVEGTRKGDCTKSAYRDERASTSGRSATIFLKLKLSRIEHNRAYEKSIRFVVQHRSLGES